MAREKNRDLPIMQRCLGKDCEFLKDYNACIHKHQIDDAEFCMLVYENKIHTHDEISEIMGISKAAVIYLEKKALEKMRLRMLEQLGDSGLEPNDIF